MALEAYEGAKVKSDFGRAMFLCSGAASATGDAAFPNAKIIRASALQQDVDEMGMKCVGIFAERGPELAEILKGATFRKPHEVVDNEKTVDLGGVHVRLVRLGPGHTRGDTQQPVRIAPAVAVVYRELP